MEDRDLVNRVRTGDDKALESIFREHYAGLVAFAARYVGERARAEELVQSLFADLWADRARWRVDRSVRGYLYTAVRNRALNARRRALVEVDWEPVAHVAELDAIQWRPPRPDEALEMAEDADRLAAAIARLPERCRITMQLRWRDRLSYQEIAETLGISVKGVENQLARGLKALREYLK
jgi:RNA polymerase sigma-70 factor, ECF subfamily